MQFEATQLFGGAMQVDIPDGYYDVSTLRQVPDHQEVFQEKDGFDSIIIEIMEYLPNMSATAAARFHLEDYTEESSLKIWYLENTEFPKLSSGTPVGAILATTPSNEEGKCTGIYLLNARLDQHDTDILITMNLNNVSVNNANLYLDLLSDSADPAFKRGREIVDRIVATFDIKQSSLFHPGG